MTQRFEPGDPAMTDVVVVGGGVIGMSVAWELRERGASVLLLERDRVGASASWAGGGILSPLPPGSDSAALQPLLQDSLRRYPAWCQRLHEASDIDPEYWVCGATYFSGGIATELPELAQVRSPRLLKGLALALQRSRIAIREHSEVLGWHLKGTRLAGVRLRDGLVRCRSVVVAAGAWSGGLGSHDVVPVKGQMLLYQTVPGALQKILIGDRAYLIPRRDGHVLVGSTLEHTGYDQTTTGEARQWLIEQGIALWPALADLDVKAHWAGLRPGYPADAPLIASDPQIEGVVHCTGHFRIGITLAPASAAAAAALVLDDRVS